MSHGLVVAGRASSQLKNLLSLGEQTLTDITLDFTGYSNFGAMMSAICQPIKAGYHFNFEYAHDYLEVATTNGAKKVTAGLSAGEVIPTLLKLEFPQLSDTPPTKLKYVFSVPRTDVDVIHYVVLRLQLAQLSDTYVEVMVLRQVTHESPMLMQRVVHGGETVQVSNGLIDFDMEYTVDLDTGFTREDQATYGPTNLIIQAFDQYHDTVNDVTTTNGGVGFKEITLSGLKLQPMV